LDTSAGFFYRNSVDLPENEIFPTEIPVGEKIPKNILEKPFFFAFWLQAGFGI